MPEFYSQNGNVEVWDVKPDGYFTFEEYQEKYPLYYLRNGEQYQTGPDSPPPSEAITLPPPSKFYTTHDGESWIYSEEKYAATFKNQLLYKQAKIAEAHDAFLRAQSLEYSDMEKQTWDMQRAEAQGLIADPQAAAPLVRAIAKARGMDVLELAARIQRKAEDWAQLAGHVTGQRLAYQDALDACTTLEDIQSIVVEFTGLDEA